MLSNLQSGKRESGVSS